MAHDEIRWQRYEEDSRRMWLGLKASDQARYRAEIRVAKAARAMATTRRDHELFGQIEAEYRAACDARDAFHIGRRQTALADRKTLAAGGA